MRSDRISSLRRLGLLGLMSLVGSAPSAAQQVDCARLQQLIQQGGAPRGNAGAMRRQAAEIGRTQAMIRQYGCDGFSFFGGNPQCNGLTQRLQALQSGLAQLQNGGGGGGGANGDLVARYNAYCRGGQPPEAPKSKGFFESLFGGGEEHRDPLPQPPVDELRRDDDGGDMAHGGSQAVCVRTCDGGFFPLGISARNSKENLVEMCHALCPGAETEVYTRNPDADIKTAASLDGKAYTEMPNAMKFEKTFVASCSCRQPGKGWAETLANAEEVLGNTRKGDIVVTKEKSDELSRPKLDPKTTSAILAKKQATPGAPAQASPGDAAKLAGATAAADPSAPPSGGIRRVGPQP